jgi:hypothetical protein
LTNCGGTWSSSAGRSKCDTAESVLRPQTQVCNERYSALMTHARHVHLLLAPVLLASVALAQSADGQAATGAAGEESIAAARSQYTQTADIPPDANDGTTLAQLPRRGPGMPFPPQHGYPGRPYQTPWMDHGDAGHTLIGAAIGFGAGAAIGACGSDSSGTTRGGRVIIGGVIFAVIGGFIGGSHPWQHARRVYRPSGLEDDEESDRRSHSKAREGDPEPSASGRHVSPGQPASAETMAWRSSGMPAVP